METSPTIKALAAALLTFSVKVEKIKKTSDNPFFKSKYAALPDILDVIATPLQECELVLSQHPDGEGLTTMLIHAPSGEWMRSTGIMRPAKRWSFPNPDVKKDGVHDIDPQTLGSAITYQRRYSISGILNLNIDEDDDGNNASHPVGNIHERPTSATPPAYNGGGKYPEDNRPWLTEKEFQTALQAIKAGDATVYGRCNDNRRMKKDYRLALQAAEEALTDQTPGNAIDNTDEIPF